MQSSGKSHLSLQKVFVTGAECRAHSTFIYYPKLAPDQLISISSLNYKELWARSETWDRKSPLLASHELSVTSDLTDNEIVIRQINCQELISRCLEQDESKRES